MLKMDTKQWKVKMKSRDKPRMKRLFEECIGGYFDPKTNECPLKNSGWKTIWLPVEMRNERNPGCSGYIGDNTTQ